MNITILSRGPGNYSTRRLKEAAREKGHDVTVLNHTSCYVEIEQNKPSIRVEGHAVAIPEAIIPRIGTSVTRYGSAIVRQFEMRDVFTTAKSIAIVRARDKLRSLQLLAKYGIDTPKTVFARKPSDIDDLIKLVGGPPLIVKLASGTHGQGVVLAETTKAAKSVLQAFYSLGVSVLVQEFIEESEGADIRVIVVGGRAVAAYKRQGLAEEFRANIHMGGKGEKVKITKEERRIAIKAARVMGLSIAGVDLLRSNRGPLVIEVNSSPGLRGVETTTGRDVAAKIIEYIELNAKRKPKKDRIGA